MPSTGETPPLAAYDCDGRGRGTPLDWAGVRGWSRRGGPGFRWVHLDVADASHQRWLRDESGLDPVSCDALLASETRPRYVPGDDLLLVILRGVNLNEGQEPDDMVSLRICLRPGEVVSTRMRRLLAVQDIRDRLRDGGGPCTPVEFVVQIAELVVARQFPVVDNLEEILDDVEESMLVEPAQALRSQLAEVRRQVIGLRRYLAPQRDVLARLVGERFAGLDDACRARLREVADRQTRIVEDLDAARDRAAVAGEELAGRLAERLGRNTYVLSIVAGVFLPLGLLTGLLGINVGGIPGTESDYAFAVVCALLVVLAGLALWLLRRRGML